MKAGGDDSDTVRNKPVPMTGYARKVKGARGIPA